MPNYPENSRQQPMFTRHPFGEPKWQLQSQSEFDGLAPSQIVRYLNAGDRGFEDSEVQGRLAARLDATPDADNYVTNPAAEGEAKGVTVDAHRYVVDPIVDNDHHQYVGLYTGGPVRTTNEPSREGGFHKRCTQVLTRTFCAGHGYWVDEAGRYHAAWPDGNGGWTGRNPDVKQVVFKRPSEAASEDTDAPPEGAVIREYMTADDALKAHRPWLDSKLSPYMALHPEAFPSTFVREVYWREFTHESIAALEELGSDRARLEAVVAYHFTEKVAPQVLDAHCRLDPQTNTVVFVCSLMYVDLGEPQTPDDLLDLPCLVAPCTRETLRMFGWNQLRDGEGYKYTHVFRWPRLKDTPEVRRAIEFVRDNKAVEAAYKKDEQGNYILDGNGNRILLHPAAASWILALLAKHDPPAAGPTEPPGYAGYEKLKNPPTVINNSDADELGVTVADNTGRLTAPLSVPRNATVGSGDPFVVSTTSPAQFYRIAQQQVQVEQDGSLSFSIALVRTEWHGADSETNWESGGTRQLADLSSAEGWGRTEHRVIPSVPRENAIPTMLGIKGSTYRLVVSKRQTEGSDGHSDVSFQQFPLYNYTDGEHTPENIQNPFDIDFDAVSQSYNPYPRPSYSVTYERVAPGSVGPLIQKIKSLMGKDPAISVVYHPEGYYTVSARGTGKTPRHIEEWLVAADWFQHKTVEKWLGVTLDTKGGSGQDASERGFYETITVNPTTGEETKSGWHSLASIRGDLDANWMGAETSSQNTLYASTGPNDGKTEISFSHGHDHGHWGAMGVASDPDATGGNGEASDQGDGSDKLRSHALTHVDVSTNEDGTFNFSIERTYPHQRVWVWKERQAKRKGDWRNVYRAHYRNWPSRHAIYKDLVTNFVSWVETTYGESINLNGDDWQYGYSPSINKFGLVDDTTVVLAPINWNKPGRTHQKDQPIPNKTETFYYYKWKTQPNQPGTAKTDPWSAEQKPPFAPMLGFYFCVERGGRAYGTYDSMAKAFVAYYSLSPMPGSTAPHLAGKTAGGAPYFSFDAILPASWGPWYNGDMPKAENNWGAGNDGQGGAIPAKNAQRRAQMAAAKQRITDLNGTLAGITSDASFNYVDPSIFNPGNDSGQEPGAATLNMTEADWEAWYNGSSTDSSNTLNNTCNAAVQAAVAHAAKENGGQSQNQGSGSQEGD